MLKYGSSVNSFHEFYCKVPLFLLLGYLFTNMNNFWTSYEPKPTILQFEQLFKEYQAVAEQLLLKRQVDKVDDFEFAPKEEESINPQVRKLQ